ncbi:hypothetical protein HN51_000111 [Arachis hypogaea]
MNSVGLGSSNLCINDTLTDDELRSILAMVSHACSNWTLPSPIWSSICIIVKIKEKDTSKNLGMLWDDLEKAIEETDEIEIGKVDCGDHQRSFMAYAYNVVSHVS